MPHNIQENKSIDKVITLALTGIISGLFNKAIDEVSKSLITNISDFVKNFSGQDIIKDILEAASPPASASDTEPVKSELSGEVTSPASND